VILWVKLIIKSHQNTTQSRTGLPRLVEHVSAKRILPVSMVSSSTLQIGCSIYGFDYVDERNAMMKFNLQFREVYGIRLMGLENELSLFLLDGFFKVAFSSSKLEIELSLYAFRLSRQEEGNGEVCSAF
jgi:hypothetical protein